MLALNVFNIKIPSMPYDFSSHGTFTGFRADALHPRWMGWRESWAEAWLPLLRPCQEAPTTGAAVFETNTTSRLL